MAKLGLDIDGVLCDFITAYKALIVELTAKNLFPADAEWGCWDFDRQCGYVNNPDLNMVWKHIQQSSTFWELLKPYPETQEVLWQLYGLILKGHDVYFITTRPGGGEVSAKRQTEGWLKYQMGRPQIGFIPTVLITSEKGTAAEALALDYYIDDKWENCTAVSAVDGVKVYLMDRPWNRDNDAGVLGIKRVGSVMEMIGEIV